MNLVCISSWHLHQATHLHFHYQAPHWCDPIGHLEGLLCWTPGLWWYLSGHQNWRVTFGLCHSRTNLQVKRCSDSDTASRLWWFWWGCLITKVWQLHNRKLGIWIMYWDISNIMSSKQAKSIAGWSKLMVIRLIWNHWGNHLGEGYATEDSESAGRGRGSRSRKWSGNCWLALSFQGLHLTRDRWECWRYLSETCPFTHHLIVFSSLGLSYHIWTFSIFGYLIYLGHENHLTSHLLLHKAEIYYPVSAKLNSYRELSNPFGMGVSSAGWTMNVSHL